MTKMEGHGRRNRRGRHSHQFIPIPPDLQLAPQAVIQPSYAPPPRKDNSWSSSFFSLLIMACLISIIYLMLDYHCHTCAARCNLDNISKNIETIADNLAIMKSNYHDLETKVSLFSQELPKLEGQLEILEVLANSGPPGEYGRIGWDPKSSFCLPNVDVYLNHCTGARNKTNSSGTNAKQCLKCPRPTKVK